MAENPRIASGGCVVVLGATTKPDRYACMAMRRLKECGYRAIPVNPAFSEVLGERCYASISEIDQPIDTLTMYVGKQRSTPLISEIVRAKPRRIIFNPDAENKALADAAAAAGIETLEACTLVMLEAGTF